MDTMYDPAAPDSPHLEGAQPTWEDLPYACEMIHMIWMSDEPDPIDQLQSVGEPNKINQLLTLFKPNKLGLLTDDDQLAPNGVWVAANFEPPSQQGIDGIAGLGSKSKLSPTEQALFQMLLFEKDWVPMLATINQLATEAVSTVETDARAEGFRDRVSHLTGYRRVKSINSWKKKAQAHFEWALHLGLAYRTQHNDLTLTGFGQQLHEQLRSNYHTEWPA